MAQSTGDEAHGRVVRQMSMRDPEDISLTRGIVTDQQQVIDYANRVQRGEIVPTRDTIPLVNTFPPQATGRYRHIVIVKGVDSNSGERLENAVELYSDVPLPRQAIVDSAIQATIDRRVIDSPGAKLPTESAFVPRTAVIISITRRE